MAGLSLLWSCREVSRRLADGRYDDGPAVERWLARAHLLFVCGYCRRFLRQLRLLSRAAQDWTGALLDPASQADFEKRLLSKLRER
jgi:hypothetical protein